MKKIKHQNIINNQEDEDSSTYPLYPETDDIYNEELKDEELSKNSNVKVIEPFSKINDLQDTEFNSDSKRNMLDVPGAELDDGDEKFGEEDEENNYYSNTEDNHDNLEEHKED